MTKLANSDQSEKYSGSSQPAEHTQEVERLAADLSDFQTKALLTLASGDHYGLGIKERLEEYYGEEINHGRLYPNLDKLVEYGLVEKSERDRRTNNYSLTESGRRVIEYEHWHLETCTDGGGR